MIESETNNKINAILLCKLMMRPLGHVIPVPLLQLLLSRDQVRASWLLALYQIENNGVFSENMIVFLRKTT